MHNPCSSIEVKSSSPSTVVVKYGKPLDLFCESKTPYQWCYFAHNISEFLTTASYSSELVSQPSGMGFDWKKSNTRCGLHVESTDKSWEGAWKCHLAVTDSVSTDDIM